MDPLVESALISGVATLVGVGGTVAVAIVGFRSTRQANQATINAAHDDVRRTLDVTRREQVSDRYLRAVEQLGSDVLEVRIGATYALERVTVDSTRDQPIVMEVLSAFIRERSREPWPIPEPNASPVRAHAFPRPDVQAALTVIGRRNVEYDQGDIDLTAAVLPSALLFSADLTRVRLVSADLRAAVAHSGTKFTDADLRNADLTGADLTEADLTGADLTDAILTGANLTGARWPENTPVPQGWVRDSGSAQLRKSRSDANDSSA
jgi:Pentapeptide repeats (8 copies)